MGLTRLEAHLRGEEASAAGLAILGCVGFTPAAAEARTYRPITSRLWGVVHRRRCFDVPTNLRFTAHSGVIVREGLTPSPVPTGR